MMLIHINTNNALNGGNLSNRKFIVVYNYKI